MRTQSVAMMMRLCNCSTLALLLAVGAGAGCSDDTNAFPGGGTGGATEGSGGASASGSTIGSGGSTTTTSSVGIGPLAVARSQANGKTFIDYLQPTPITCSPLSSATWGVAGVLPRDLCNGIESTNGAGVAPTYLYWDGQIIAGKDGTYHMFMSTWADSLGFNPGWTNSESYHAVSTQGVLGPYTRKGYVWSSGSHHGHNTSALELPDGTYAVIVSEVVPFTIYTSSSLDGPWTACPNPTGELIQTNGVNAGTDTHWDSNVSVTARADGKFELVQRHGLIAIADTICGPYKMQKPTWTYPAANLPSIDSIYPHRTSVPDPAITNPTYAWEEDPHIWYSGGVYHVLYSGSGDRIGYHLYSTDGITNWKDDGLAFDPRMYQKIFGYVGSTTYTQWYKMERPSVVLQNGHVTHVTWAVADVDKDNSIPAGSNHGSKIIVVPFDGVAFDNDYGTIPPSNPPSVATAATATPNPVAGSTTALSVLGADDGGEANLIYTWTTTGTPPAAVTFSANGTNAAKATTATFTKAGSYTLQATIKDQGNQTATSAVVVTVSPTFTSIAVAPPNATVSPSAPRQFTATALDQFATSLSTQPTFTWSVSGGGTISSSGLFTAGAVVGGPYTVTAQSGGISGTASVSVTTAPIAVYQIDCGSTSAVSPFAADQYSSGGTLHTVTNTIAVSGVTNAAPMAVYQSERYGNVTYTFPNLTAGSQYTVRLHFAELYQTAAGKRVFNVAINSTTVLSNFDIYATAGGNYKALVREYTATANASGQIMIQFTTVTDNATIGGIEILTSIPNGSPSIVTAAAASPNPVAGSSTALSVLGADDSGEPNLTYTWATTGTPPAAVTFSANATNAAKNTTATFTKAGTYALQVTVKDGPGLTVTSPVSVVVNATLTSIVVSPPSASITTSGTQQFTATALDQFATSLAIQPTFNWTVSGGGAISTSGLFTADVVPGGPYTVTAQSDTVSGTASVTVSLPNAAPTIATAAAANPNPVTGTTGLLSVLGADDAGESALTYTWATTGTPPAAVTFSANATNAAKATTATFTKAGTYAFQVTVKDQPGLTAISTVSVVVNATLTSIVVSPSSATITTSATQQFTATARDQFATNLSTQPTFTWTASGGSISASGLYTAGATAGGPYTVTAQSGAVSGTASVTVGSAVVYQINCGSTSAASPFKADQYGSGGTQRTVTNTITISGITNPAPQAVYQSERWGTSTYTFPSLTSGPQYTVRLHFAELYQTATGKRVFNVLINGTTVLSNFDIYAAAGGNYKAVLREFTATANSSGQIVINFNTVTDNATIEGIEIIKK